MSRRKKQQLEELRRRAKRRETREKSHHDLLPSLAYAQRLIDRGKLTEAHAHLQQLDADYPRRKEVLWMLADVCQQTDTFEFWKVCRRLIELEPDNRESLLMYAYANLHVDHPISALQAFRKFLERWPRDPRGEGILTSIGVLEGKLEAKRTEFKFTSDDALEMLLLHEQISEALLEQRYKRVVELADQLLTSYPHFEAAHNNRAEALFHLGRLDEAIAQCRRGLAYNPQNGFTLATLARFLFLRGDSVEAQACAERLKSLGPRTLSAWAKAAETLSVLGDSAGVLKVFEQAQAKLTEFGPPCSDAALLVHFAAAAHMERGDEAEARRLWQQALEWFPGSEFAKGNLRDLQDPVGERYGSWAVGFQVWLSLLAYDEVNRCLKPGQRGAVQQKDVRRRILELCPQVPRLIPILLERGDPHGCTLAWFIASTSDEPAMLEILRAFALGQRGPDSMRLKTLRILTEKRALSDRRLKIWLRGEWDEQILFAWDIYHEPVKHGWPREVVTLFSQATEALQQGDADRAEGLLERALTIQPNAPELLNNLGAAYEVQGRRKEAVAMGERIYREHPDYFFGVGRSVDGPAEASRQRIQRAVLCPSVYRASRGKDG
jgi:tetratricopeptide (TPR) repeat protein